MVSAERMTSNIAWGLIYKHIDQSFCDGIAQQGLSQKDVFQALKDCMYMDSSTITKDELIAFGEEGPDYYQLTSDYEMASQQPNMSVEEIELHWKRMTDYIKRAKKVIAARAN